MDQALEQFFARKLEATVLDRLDELEQRVAELERGHASSGTESSTTDAYVIS